MFRKATAALWFTCMIVGCSGKTGNDLYADGVKELANNNPNGAIVLLKNALEKDQNHCEARYQLARAYLAAGKLEQAEKEFLKVQRLNPYQGDLKLDLAKLYNQQRKPDLAITMASEHLALKPDSAEALEVLGMAHARQKNLVEAEKYLLQALTKAPTRSSSKIALASLYAGEQKVDQARQLLEQVITADHADSRAYLLLAGIELSRGRKAEALAIYQRLAVINTTDPFPLYKGALIQLDRGETEVAAKAAADLIARFPKSAEGYRLKGLVCYRQKDFPEAINALQESLKIQPNIAGYYFLGLSLYNRGELETALSQFRRILDLAPSFQQARLLVGMVLLRQNRVDDAITEIGRLLQADDGNAMAHNILGSAYLAKGMVGEGLKELNRATALDPMLVDTHMKKGLFHLSQGQAGEAEADLSAAVQIAPEILNTRLILSSYYLQRNNRNKALAVLEEGLSGKSSDAHLYSAMARIMFLDRNRAQGTAYLEKAKEADPGAIEPYLALAAVHATGGDGNRAIEECSAALRKEPRNVRALMQMAVIQESLGREKEALDYHMKAKATGASEAFVGLAAFHVRKGDRGKAIALLEEGVKYQPRSAPLLELKGRLEIQESRFKEAVQTANDLEAIAPEKAVTLKASLYLAMDNPGEAIKQATSYTARYPDSVLGYQTLAAVYHEQKNMAKAIEVLTKGVSIDDKPQARLMLAEMYAKAGKTPQAIKICEELIRKRPSLVPPIFVLGTILDGSGNKKEAARKYLQALSVDAGHVPSLNNIAYLYAEGYGDSREGVKYAETALALEPSNAGVMDTLGYALYRTGRLQDARAILEKAARLLPDDPTVNYHLALVHKQGGETGPARERVQKALKAGGFPDQAQAKKLLSQLK